MTAGKKRDIKRTIKAEHDISNTIIWFGPGGTGADTISDHLLHSLHARKTMERHKADIFVVKDLDNFFTEIKFVASLVSGTIATCEYVQSSGKRGAAITYSRAVAIKRVINVSPEFMRLHPYICADMHQVMQHVGTRWTLANLPGIVEHLGPAGAARTRKQREVIVFVSEAEHESEDRLTCCVCDRNKQFEPSRNGKTKAT